MIIDWRSVGKQKKEGNSADGASHFIQPLGSKNYFYRLISDGSSE
jgi:hypothetical protein